MWRTILVLVVPASVAASPADIVSAPLVLAPGEVEAALTFEASFAPNQLAAPASLAPDLAYGLTSRLTLALVQSEEHFDRVPYYFEPGTSICISRDVVLCHRRYHGSAIEARYALGDAVVAHAALVLRDVDPILPALLAGATVRWQHGRFAATGDPYLQVGLANTDLGNRARLWLPLELAVQPTCRWALVGRTGLNTAFSVDAGYAVPVELGTRVRVLDGVIASAAVGFPTLVGPLNVPRERVFWIQVAWRSRT